MKKSILNVLLGLIVIFFTFQSCEKDENESETKISSYNSSESHNTGLNCMGCHNAGGSGEGVFTAAGTVYYNDKTTTYPGATVKLYSEASGGGTLIASIAVGQIGNFYTTQRIDFGSGLYAQVEGNSGTKNMSSKITTGACNSCHGNNVGPVWTE